MPPRWQSLSWFEGADQIAGDTESGSSGSQGEEQPWRVALRVEYQGTHYNGFQLQLNQPTIQGALERALRRFTGECIRVRGASRTDSGAHAKGQVVDFLTTSRHPVSRFSAALNFFLPEGIRILDAVAVDEGFHSRRSALGRVYRYHILARPEPTALLRHTHYWVREPLGVGPMAEAASALVGTHDFRAIASGHPLDRSAVRTVRRWEVSRIGDEVVIECEANGFLKQQIRRANGILLYIGRGKQLVELMGNTLEAKNNVARVPTLPARGLCLVEVKYPEEAIDFPPAQIG